MQIATSIQMITRSKIKYASAASFMPSFTLCGNVTPGAN